MTDPIENARKWCDQRNYYFHLARQGRKWHALFCPPGKRFSDSYAIHVDPNEAVSEALRDAQQKWSERESVEPFNER